MNRSNSLLLVAIFFVLSTILGCKHTISLSCEDVNFSISATTKDAILNNNNGSISVTASGGEQFKYSLN